MKRLQPSQYTIRLSLVSWTKALHNHGQLARIQVSNCTGHCHITKEHTALNSPLRIAITMVC